MDLIRNTIEWMLTLRLKSGNFPMSDQEQSDELVQVGLINKSNNTAQDTAIRGGRTSKCLLFCLDICYVGVPWCCGNGHDAVQGRPGIP